MIKKILLLLIFCSIMLYGFGNNKSTSKSNLETHNIILETDIGNDVDDALALDMLYKYQDMGKVNILGIMTNKESKYSAEFIDIMNTWYGYPQIPIGIIHNGVDCEADATNYAKCVCLLQNKKGKSYFKHTVKDFNQLPEAQFLYRKILAQQPDNSVTIISIGFFTNLARLLNTTGDKFSPLTGKELVAKKVKLLCTMAGCFNDSTLLEYNVVKDIPSAKKVFEEWPTKIITSPFEVGVAIKYPGNSIENDFKWASIHPMVEAYKCYQKMPYDRPTWDLTTVLYSVENSYSFFNISKAGKIIVNEKGRTIFVPDNLGNRYYLTINENQTEKIKQHFIKIITQKPKRYK
ncbi:nucleoside hydrolase [Porphyromonadaceae sp. NP-X]|nr:nucleoside hydrolase [Porphyromonadaceae sp. NP-X]